MAMAKEDAYTTALIRESSMLGAMFVVSERKLRYRRSEFQNIDIDKYTIITDDELNFKIQTIMEDVPNAGRRMVK